MRSVVVDYARQRLAQKRGGDLHRVTELPEEVEGGLRLDEETLGLDTALTRLAAVDERLAQVVELRYFAGLVGARDRQPAQAFRTQHPPRLAEGAAVPAGVAQGRLTSVRPMDAERWQRLSPLLDAMFELDPDTRARSLELLREEDAEPGGRPRVADGAVGRARGFPLPAAGGPAARHARRAADRSVPAGADARRRRHGPGVAGQPRRRSLPASRRAQAAAARDWPIPSCACASPASARSSRGWNIRTSRACSMPASATTSRTWRWNTSTANRSPTGAGPTRRRWTCGCGCSCRPAKRSATRTPT